MEVNPDRRDAVRKRIRRHLRDAGATERLSGGSRRRIEARAEAVDDRNRDHGRDGAPVLPAMEAAQIVGAHDPDEAYAGAAGDEVGERIVGVAGTDLGFEAADIDARMAGEPARRGDALA